MTEPLGRERGQAAPGEDASPREVRATLGLGLAAFGALTFVMLGRITNTSFGDVEFTGWSAAVASHLLAGDRPYVDTVLPIPPGSFALLAAIEWLRGTAHVSSELWLNAALHGLMAVLAYDLGRSIASRRVAVATALVTLVTVTGLNKECAYDHTAQATAWGSLALGARAWLRAEAGPTALFGAGVLAGLTLLFKQSTGVGILAAWAVGAGYLALSGSGALRARLSAARPLATGALVGLLGTWGAVAALGAPLSAFLQATFRDGAVLKGGSGALARNLLVYLLEYPAHSAPIAAVLLAAALGSRVASREGSLHLGGAPRREGGPGRRERLAVAWVAVIVPLVLAGYLLAVPFEYRRDWVASVDLCRLVPPLGLFAAIAAFGVQLWPAAETTPAARSRGHALNAIVLVALVTSLLHNTSAPEFRPFYDNNAIIPVAVALLFAYVERARVPGLALALVAVSYGGVAGNKFFRAAEARETVTLPGFWEGMRVSPRGRALEDAARRARELAGAEGTVLVLPEDAQLVALIGRPRPALRGAILFVDQYAPRLVEHDIQRIDEAPPAVIVIAPSERLAWQRFYRIWSGTSGAEAVLTHVLDTLLPSRYRLDSTHPMSFYLEEQRLEIHVRDDLAPARGTAPPPGE